MIVKKSKKAKKKISNVIESDKSFRRINFDNVTFSYPSNPNKKVLDNICFELEPGSMTALVGPSGAGKSTIFSLLLGFTRLLMEKLCLMMK